MAQGPRVHYPNHSAVKMSALAELLPELKKNGLAPPQRRAHFEVSNFGCFYDFYPPGGGTVQTFRLRSR